MSAIHFDSILFQTLLPRIAGLPTLELSIAYTIHRHEKVLRPFEVHPRILRT